MKLSIITIHLNDFQGLGRTMKSLARVMGAADLEWIVVDGGSRKADDHYNVLVEAKQSAHHFVSEEDDGIYDAMNKGANLASGDYVQFLNAGDELHLDFNLEKLFELMLASRPEMIWGGCQEFYMDGSLVQVKTRSPSWAWYCMPAYHPAIFFRRDVLGPTPYDTQYRIAADYELICRLLSEGAKVVELKSLVSIFHHGGLSGLHAGATRKEENQIRLKYYNVPAFAGEAIVVFKTLNSQLAKVAWLRRLWRKWI